MAINRLSEKRKIPVETGDIIAELVKKYKLGPVGFFDNSDISEMEKILSKAKTPEERLKIIKKMPFEKIFDIVEEIARNKIEIKNLPKTIKKKLDLSAEISKNLAKDIENEIFIAPEKEPNEKIEVKKKSQHKTFGSDSYREPI